jgi:hypothetical protein
MSGLELFVVGCSWFVDGWRSGDAGFQDDWIIGLLDEWMRGTMPYARKFSQSSTRMRKSALTLALSPRRGDISAAAVW